MLIHSSSRKKDDGGGDTQSMTIEGEDISDGDYIQEEEYEDNTIHTDKRRKLSSNTSVDSKYNKKNTNTSGRLSVIKGYLNDKRKPSVKNPVSLFIDKPRNMNRGYLKFNRNHTEEKDESRMIHVLPDKSCQNDVTLRIYPDKWQAADVSVYPMIQLTRRGFWPTESVRDTLWYISAELREDRDSIKNMKKTNKGQQTITMNSNYTDINKKPNMNMNEFSTSSDGGGSVSGSGGGSTKQLGTTKIIIPFGRIVSKYGYDNRISKPLIQETLREYSKNKKKRYEDFYKGDEIDVTMPFRQPPKSYRIFEELVKKYGQSFKNRTDNLSKVSSLTPKPHMPELSRTYIEDFRFPPLGIKYGQRQCPKGRQCLFWTFTLGANSPFNRIGREFLLPCQLAHYNETKELPAPTELCIDCYLFELTNNLNFNTSTNYSPTKPMNKFIVKCEIGEYSDRVMLPQVLDGRPTGICGFVPRYSSNLRAYMKIKKRIIRDDGVKEIIDISYLAEVNTDF